MAAKLQLFASKCTCDCCAVLQKQNKQKLDGEWQVSILAPLSRLTSRRRRKRRLVVLSVASSTTGALWTLCPPLERRRDQTPTPKCFDGLKEKHGRHHSSLFTKLNVILLYRIKIGLDKNEPFVLRFLIEVLSRQKWPFSNFWCKNCSLQQFISGSK